MYPDSATAQAALKRLVAGGYGRWVEGEKPSRGGRQSLWFECNPTHYVSYVCSGEDEPSDPGATDTRANT